MLLTCRCKHSCNDDEPSFNQVMLMIATQRVNEQREQQSNHGDDRKECHMRFQEQREQCMMQMKMF